MKKHFTGIALFIFIVGISGFVASLFNEIPNPKIFEVQNTVPVYESRKKCSKKYPPGIKITQAVYNEKTDELSTEFLVESGFSPYSNLIKLFFFTNDADGSRFVSEGTFRLNNYSYIETDVFEKETWEIRLIKKSDLRKNLYVIAVPFDNYITKKTPIFDESKAIAVLIADK